MNEQKNNLVIPAAIIIAGFVVAAGIYLSNKGNSPAPVVDTNQNNSSNIVSDRSFIYFILKVKI